MYRILKPTYFKHPDGENWGIRFTAIPGVVVASMAEAKRLYGGAPVLEFCGGGV